MTVLLALLHGAAQLAAVQPGAQWVAAAQSVTAQPAARRVAVPLAPPSVAAQGAARSVTVGRVTAVYWPGHERLAVALAEVADHERRFPGFVDSSRAAVRLVLARGATAFDSLTGGRAPHWGGGAALPGARLIVLNVGRGPGAPSDLSRVLRHELAHLALARHARARVPRWFEEGYAALAAGEWQHGEVLQLNVAVARGRVPPLSAVDGGLRGSRAEARQAYALAASAVLLLDRWGGNRGLEPLIEPLGRGEGFERALREGYGITTEQFEVLWQRDLRRRYGWLAFAAAAGVVWGGLALVTVALWGWRRRRDRARRARLEVLDDEELPA